MAHNLIFGIPSFLDFNCTELCFGSSVGMACILVLASEHTSIASTISSWTEQRMFPSLQLCSCIRDLNFSDELASLLTSEMSSLMFSQSYAYFIVISNLIVFIGMIVLLSIKQVRIGLLPLEFILGLYILSDILHNQHWNFILILK
jgi:hypothetical protein